MPPRIAIVREITSFLITQRSKSTILLSTNQNWIRKFIDRHEVLKSKYNRKYDYQRVKCEDSKLIRVWFQRVQATIAKYNIHEDDIYNFDKTDFQMSVISMAKIITRSDRAGRPRTTQSGNREWVTVIETICTRSLAIPPLITFEAIMHQATWYENNLLSYE
jgi:hypothetical protein